MATMLPDAGGGRSSGTFKAMRKGGGKGGGLGQAFGTGAGKGGQNPAAGLTGRMAGQVRDALASAEAAAGSRRDAHRQMTGRLGEIDALFTGRDPAYRQAHDLALASGTREAEEWDRGQQRENRWDMLERGLAGGSADVAVQSAQRQALGDVMGGVRARARGAERQAREGDLGLRDRMRQGVLGAMPWQGAAQYRPMLGSVPDFQGAHRRHTRSLLGTLGSGGLFS